MTYEIVKADCHISQIALEPYVFLGGNCRGRDWRLEFYHRFENSEVTFISPRRESFADPEIDPAAHADQVAWERDMLSKCHMAVYWLGEGLANQASRVEIGYVIGQGKPLVVGAESGFLGMEHLTSFTGLVLSSSVDGLMNRFASMLSEFHAK